MWHSSSHCTYCYVCYKECKNWANTAFHNMPTVGLEDIAQHLLLLHKIQAQSQRLISSQPPVAPAPEAPASSFDLARTGVTGGCKPPEGTVNLIQVLWKSSQHL